MCLKSILCNHSSLNTHSRFPTYIYFTLLYMAYGGMAIMSVSLLKKLSN